MSVTRVVCNKVLLIAGATCSGKSALAINLAKRYNAELISADALQIYTHIPIASNKQPINEIDGVVHHCIGSTKIDRHLTVHDFRTIVHRLVDDIIQRGKRVILVGGNMYWIEACTLQSNMQEHVPQTNIQSNNQSNDQTQSDTLTTSSSDQPVNPFINQPISDNISKLISQISHSNSDVSLAQQLASLDDATFQSLVQTIKSRYQSQEQSNNQTIGQTNSLSSIELRSFVSHLCWPPAMDLMPASRLHALLTIFDPSSAERLHVNDHRKIGRALAVFVESGTTHSSRIAEDRARSMSLMFDAAMIWLDCERSALDARIRSRVDDMMTQGLLAECQELYDLLSNPTPEALQAQNEREEKIREIYDPNCTICPQAIGQPLEMGVQPIDCTRGMAQALGFKEFLPYFEHMARVKRGEIAADAAAESQLLGTCIEAMKCATCRYAKKQDAWIQHRMYTNQRINSVLPIYRLDGSDRSYFDKRVRDPAAVIMQAFLDDHPLDSHHFDSLAVSLPPARATVDHGSAWKKHRCDVCQIEANGEHEWKIHLAGRKHRRAVQRAASPFPPKKATKQKQEQSPKTSDE